MLAPTARRWASRCYKNVRHTCAAVPFPYIHAFLFISMFLLLLLPGRWLVSVDKAMAAEIVETETWPYKTSRCDNVARTHSARLEHGVISRAARRIRAFRSPEGKRERTVWISSPSAPFCHFSRNHNGFFFLFPFGKRGLRSSIMTCHGAWAGTTKSQIFLFSSPLLFAVSEKQGGSCLFPSPPSTLVPSPNS